MKKLLLVLYFCLLQVVPCLANTVEVTSGFGWRMHPIYGYNKFHTGVDLGYAYGTPVGALGGGTVALAEWYGGYGFCVIIRHDNGDSTLYGHLARITVSPGERVEMGRMVGLSGSTGVSTGPHLHVEWWHDGQYCNPLPLFANGGLFPGMVGSPSGVYVAGEQLVIESEKKGPDWLESQLAFQYGNQDNAIRREEKPVREERPVTRALVPGAYSVAQREQIASARRMEEEARKPKDSLWFVDPDGYKNGRDSGLRF